MTASATDRTGSWQSLLRDEPTVVSAPAPAVLVGEPGQRLLQRAVPLTDGPMALLIRAVVRSGSVRLTAVRGGSVAPVLDLEPSTGTSVGAALGLAIELPGGVTQLQLDATAPASVIEITELAYRAEPAGVSNQTADPDPMASGTARRASVGDRPQGDGAGASESHSQTGHESMWQPSRLLEDDFAGPLLSLAIPDDATRSSVLKRLQQDGVNLDLLREPGSDVSTAQAADDLQYALGLAPLVEYDLSTIQELLRRRRQGQPVGLDELAGLETEDWTKLLAACEADQEQSPAGDAPATRAARLARAFEQALPSAAFNRRAVHREPFGEAVTDFLRSHPTVDLATDDVDRLARQAAATNGASTPGKAPDDVRAVQRLYKLSPRLDQVTALHAAGFRSANEIARTGRASFINRHANALGGTASASEVFGYAARVSLAASALAADHGPAARAALPRILQATNGAAAGPDWEELFGDQLSFAGVEDSRSVFSPAAYLTDLFSFLDNIDSIVTGKTALDELLARRPDLQWMTLGAANANLTVRYIDLVNELLESAVLSHPQPSPWLTGYPGSAGSLPDGATATTGDEGWQWSIDPTQPESTILVAHQSPAAAGEHQHGFTGASTALSVAPGDLLVSWVYLDPANPPDEIMLQWTVGDADAEHRAYWTDLGDEDEPGIGAGIDGTASRWRVGPLPELGRWTRLVVPASEVGLEGTQVTGLSFIVYTDPGADAANQSKGGAWWGSATCTANAPPVETHGPSDLRGTTPQVITSAAYAPLASAVYPQQLLPFELGIETARTVLDHLAVPRHRVMEAVYGGTHAAALVDVEISTELLGVTTAERAILDGTDGHSEAQHWGLSVDPLNPDQWFKDLMGADEYLRRAGLTLEQMQTLPGAIFSYGLGLDLADPNDPSTLTVVGVSQESLGYIRRFLRLWRKLGWPHGDLERIIHNVGPKDPTGGWPSILDPLMVTLALMARLRGLIGITPLNTMSLWTPTLDGRGYVDVKTYPADGPLTAALSPYAQLFLTTATGPPNPAFRLGPEEDELADPNQTVESQSADVLAALGISATDLDLLAASAFAGLPGGPADTTALKLNLGNLSALYRCTALAKAMGLSVGEFLTLRQITGIDPFNAASLRAQQLTIDKNADASSILSAQADTVLFVEALDDMRATGITMAQLAYVLAHAFTPGDPVTPTEQQLAAVLADLQGVLVPVVQTHQPTPDPAGQVTLSELAAIPGLVGAEAAVEALNGTAVTTQKLAVPPADDLQALSGGQLTYAADSAELGFAFGAMTSAQKATLEDLSDDAAYRGAVETIFTASREPIGTLLSELALSQFTVAGLVDDLSDPAARFGALLPPIAGIVRQRLGQLLVVNKVSAAVGIDAGVCPQLLEEWLHVEDAAGDSTTALAALLALGDGRDIDKPARDALLKCFKVSQLVASLGLTRAEVVHAFTVGREHGWIDLDSLPVAAATADFAGWQRMANYVQLRAKLADTAGVLIDVFAAADAYTGDPDAGLAGVVAQLSEAFGWQAGTVTDAVATLGLTYPSAFVDQEGVLRIADAIGIAADVGAKIGWLRAVATNPLGANEGLAAWPLLAAHYDPTTWTSVGAALQDALRESRRDALVGYLQATPARLGVPEPEIDADRMLEVLLVDVEMGSCRTATRLDLAINSVQLYLQRCQLGLEPAVTLTGDQVTELARLGDYQTWVADRRIFVYPENYLDPTLRADVTELFTALQKQLLQADLTSDAAETAVLAYLDGLDEIANLEPAAVVRDLSLAQTPGTDSAGHPVISTTLTLGDTHVVARTRSSPHVYYHRVWTTLARWTPWEKVNVDIDADNLLPGILNGQLYLFWPQFSDSAEEQIPAGQGQEPTRSRQLSLAWTRLRNGQWAPKQVAPGPTLDQGASSYGLDLGNFFLRGDNLRALKYPSDAYAIVPFWFTGRSAAGVWSLALPGTFAFSPGSLTVTDSVPPAAPALKGFPVSGGDDTGFRGGVYRLTVVLADTSESAPSAPVNVTLGGAPPGGFAVLLEWPIETDLPVTYRLYRGPPGQPNAYFDVFIAPGQSSGAYLDDGTAKPTGSGSPPATTGWQAPPPQSGVTPDHQGYAVTQSAAGITLGLATLDSTGGWLGSSAVALQQVDATTRVLASPFQTDSQAPPAGAAGFISLFGLSVELGERSFLVTQAQDLSTVTTIVPAIGGNSRASTVKPDASASDPTAASAASTLAVSLGRAIGQAFSRDGPAPTAAARVLAALAGDAGADSSQVLFLPTYHPWVKLLISRLNTSGIATLFDRDVQLNPASYVQPPITPFAFSQYGPTSMVKNSPTDDIDFDPTGAYSTYNWELFFHVPLMIARGLTTNRRFAEARTWLHRIFNPNDTSTYSAPQKYWQTGGLFTYAGGTPDPAVPDLLDLLAGDGSDPAGQAAAQQQVSTWLSDPADPDGLARLRLSAYQKAVVMTYLDNLIAWGDDLFSQGTAETINQATQLYVLASQLLGPAPDLGTLAQNVQPYSLAELRGKLDDFSDPLVNVENRLAVWTTYSNAPPSYEPASVASLRPTLYFGVPVNDRLVAYWATVEDRLSKVRHCLDIQGQPATIPEFGPAVAPGALMAASFGGAGADGGSPAALPQYRYATLMQKAMELCGEVTSLGAMLLAAIEKRDAEALARIRSGQEVQLLAAARAVKQRQIDDATSAITALQRSRDVTYARQQYYLSRPFLNDQEKQQLGHLQTAAILQAIGQGFEVLGAALSLLPQAAIGIAGAAGSPQVNASFGGQQLSEVTQAFSRTLSLLASIESHQANMSGLMGGFQRRQDDWTFQANQAGKELDQIDAQISGAQIRQDIAQKELANHDLQTANAEAVDAFLVAKFSSTELYEWMIGQISTVYFQAYQLALDTARRAEQAYQHELGIYSTSFIRTGYWNALSKGLLAGEQLSYDLHRMETSYLENNRREYELTKHVSLALIDPVSLLQLRQTGECFIDLPEPLFDLDYPGHYLRRIKSIAVTVPCVTGPFGGVNCTLTMMQNRVRLSTDTDGGYAYQGSQDDRFSETLAGSQSIVTSAGQADTGLFETNLRDERYLPFEGTGAISRWHVKLPLETNRVRRDSITDFILHFRYTARDGGPGLQADARSAVVDEAYKSGTRLLSLRQNAADRWAQFASWAALGPTDPLTMTLDLNADLFPAQAPPNIGINQLQLLILTTAVLPANAAVSITSPGAASATSVALTPNPALGKIPQGVQAFSSIQPLGEWTISFPANLASLDATDIVFILGYASE